MPTTSLGPGGLTHYAFDLPTPVTLAANDAASPRGFVAVIGLTHQAYYTWNWSQSATVGSHTYQLLRGDGHTFRPLGEARALVLATPSDPGDYDNDGDGQVDAADLAMWQTHFGPPGANAVAADIPEPLTAALVA